MPRFLIRDSAGIKDLTHLLGADLIPSGFCFILKDCFLSFFPKRLALAAKCGEAGFGFSMPGFRSFVCRAGTGSTLSKLSPPCEEPGPQATLLGTIEKELP